MASLVTGVRNSRMDAVRDAIDAGAAAGTLRLYDGTPPASANDALSGNTLLSQHNCTDPCAPNAAAGVTTFSAIADDASADNTGNPSFGRFLDSDSNVVIQLTAGTSGTEIIVSSATITAGETVTVTTGGTLTDGSA